MPQAATTGGPGESGPTGPGAAAPEAGRASPATDGGGDDDAAPGGSTPGASWRAALVSAREHVKQDRVSVAAGSFAYRWFLSIFPIIIALLGIASLVQVPERVVVKLISGVTKALPAGAADVFTTAIKHSHAHPKGAVVAVVVAAVVGLWSATSGMVMVEEGLDMAYEIRRDRSFVAKRLRALPLLLGAVVLGGGASALIVFGQAIGHAIEGTAPFGSEEFLVGWTVIRWVVALALINFLFSFLYFLGPNRIERRWQWLSPGALVGTAMWAAISIGFSYYTSISGSYTRTYGAFAGVAILIFWLYLTGIAILAGAEINAAFERQSHPQPF